MSHFFERKRRSLDRPFCMFEKLGECSNQVSAFICNRHSSRYFGIVNETAHMTDGNNDEISCTVTYANSATSINIPLFWDPVTRVINMSEIRSYFRRVCGARNGIGNRENESELLCDVIYQYMGMTSYVDKCPERTWYDDNEANCIIFFNKTAETISYLKHLPTLHKLLFAFMPPSQTKDVDTDSFTIALETFGLVKENDKQPTFKIINPANVYKKTRDVNCIASPLVMAGLKWTKEQSKTVTYIKHDDTINEVCV